MKIDQSVQHDVDKHASVTGGLKRIGVVFVHGIGEQAESETVREFGGALLGWLQEWHKKRDLDVTVKTSSLSYGEQERPARFTVDLPAWERRPAQTWMLAEAWWASRLDPPGFVRLAAWGWTVLWDNVARLGANVRQKYSTPQDEPGFVRFLSAAIALLLILGIGSAVFSGELWVAAAGLVALVLAILVLRLLIDGTDRLAATRPVPPTPPDGDLPPLVRAIGLISAFLLMYGLAAAIVIGYPFIALMFALAQIPIPQVQEFILFKTLRVFLLSRIGDFYTFMYDDVQAVHIRATVPYAIEYLVKKLECEEIVVVAHSQGTVVAFDALSSGAVKEIGAVKTLVTFGTALENAWSFAPPRTTRLTGDLPPGIRWVDVWSAYDNVSGAETHSPPGQRDPNAFVEVTNSMNILTDHGGYFTNGEEFLSRLAQEIELPKGATDVTASRFHPGVEDAKTWRIRRRDRVFTMVGWRVAAILGLASALAFRAFWPGDRLRRDGEMLWQSLSQVVLAGEVVKWIDQALVALKPLEPGLARLVGIGIWSAIFTFFFIQLLRFLFGNWQARESDQSTRKQAPAGDNRRQKRQIRLRSLPAVALISAAVLMVGAISPLAPCAAAWGCDWVFVGVALVLFVALAGTVDEVLRISTANLQPSAVLRPQVLWWVWSVLLVFIGLVFVIGPWAVAARAASGALPETLFLAPPLWAYETVRNLGEPGRASYEAALWLDLLFPALYVAAFGGTMWFVVRKGIVPFAARVAVTAAILTGTCDVLENVLLLRLFDATTPPDWLPVLSILTSLKTLFGVLFFSAAIAIPVVLVGRALRKWLWERLSLVPGVSAGAARLTSLLQAMRAATNL
jgi:hypothetical protein